MKGELKQGERKMNRKIRYILAGLIIFVFVIDFFAAENPLKVELKANKQEYICGEPVLLKTTFTNLSDSNVIKGPIAFGGNFTMYIAYDGNDIFDDILWVTRVDPNLRTIATYPRQFDFYVDRYPILNTLLPGKRAERLNMFIIPRSGVYRLKAVLRKGDKEILYSSKPIQISVKTAKERYDSLIKLGDLNLFVNLGSTIFYAHHLQMIVGGYPPGESLTYEEFEKIAPVILEKCRDSAFREYVLYADIMGHERSNRSSDISTSTYRPLPVKYMDEALQFEKEYPDSWLLTDIYTRLFSTYCYERNKEKADEVRNKAIKKDPYNVILRIMKLTDTNSLKPRN